MCVACESNVEVTQPSAAGEGCDGCCGGESQPSSETTCSCDGDECLQSDEPSAVLGGVESVVELSFSADVPDVLACVPTPVAPLSPSAAAAALRPPGAPFYLLFEFLLI